MKHLSFPKESENYSDLWNKDFLDELYELYSKKHFIIEDPIQFVYQYSLKQDQELIAFLASSLAFGQRKAMIPFLSRFLSLLGTKPSLFLKSFGFFENLEEIENLLYRFIRGVDLIFFLDRISQVLVQYESIAELFREGFERNKSVKEAIIHFVQIFESIAPSKSIPKRIQKQFLARQRNIRYLLPSPQRGSACKRWNLFLRWMVRHDSVDLGLWDFIPCSSLYVPVDTHIKKISKDLGWTSRKSEDWIMCEEITQKLREMDPHDPVKYDLALFGYAFYSS